MGSLSEDQAPTDSTIPIVDFARWTTSTSQAERLAIAQDLVSACQSVGFVYITNHGLPQSLLDQAFVTAKALFALPHEKKMLAPHPDGPEVHRGYSYPGLEKVYQNPSDAEDEAALRAISDVKESYELGSEDNAEQPNVWLPEDVLPGFRSFTTKFYWAAFDVAQEILRALALGIGLEDTEYLTKSISGHHCQLRLLHYPPVRAADVEEGRVARMPAHSDWGAITLLFQDSLGGLEVEDPKVKGKFVQATPVPGACVVNVGDLLMRWSNDRLKSTLHRVNLPPRADSYEGRERLTRDRYSIPFFVTADPDTVVECLPACTDAEHPVKYAPTTQREYGRMRGQFQYRKNNKE